MLFKIFRVKDSLRCAIFALKTGRDKFKDFNLETFESGV